MQLFERSDGLDTALYKNYLYFFGSCPIQKLYVGSRPPARYDATTELPYNILLLQDIQTVFDKHDVSLNLLNY